ncbi:uncharacterized protein G2W53_032657 [Senna tora]|uniref:Uncharacterized protein n=1 Tax=Senna tora TaxID=362788 RepID=A0A834SZK0_9FABA|nr:uncharacterized protein G2W53_032657 [Senna tora]
MLSMLKMEPYRFSAEVVVAGRWSAPEARTIKLNVDAGRSSDRDDDIRGKGDKFVSCSIQWILVRPMDRSC